MVSQKKKKYQAKISRSYLRGRGSAPGISLPPVNQATSGTEARQVRRGKPPPAGALRCALPPNPRISWLRVPYLSTKSLDLFKVIYHAINILQRKRGVYDRGQSKQSLEALEIIQYDR
jgi:hypothetical protein